MGEARREQILQAAKWLFGYYGFEKTTVDDIAARASISKGSVYLEFQNKEAILLAVVQQFTERELERINGLVKLANPPYLQVLRELLFGHVMSYWSIASGQLHSPQVIASANPSIMTEILNFQSAIFLQIAFLLQKAAENSEISKRKNSNEYLYLAELVCYLLAALFPPYDRLKARDPDSFTEASLKRYADSMIDITLAGLK
ncbi:MAG: TetR/AcrR family transcriptional regulator [Candidatus Melainabacteria bacterium]|nr:TetR/AcrR family transcriptional regulator [Candidatus Melainabacteria bacterium]